MIDKIATRDGYGKKLAALDNPNIVVLTGDLAESSRVKTFAEKYPERFIQVGISEQDMFGIANGLGLSGKIPFTNTFAAFCLRGAEQIRLICINNSNVKIIGHHSGISLGADGVSQMCESDIAYMRSLPNMTVVVPCDALEAQKATEAITKVNGPCYLRISRESSPIITSEYTPFKIGKAQILHEGSDVLIVACGMMVAEAMRAMNLLHDQGINATVMNMHTIKPMDSETLISYAQKNRVVITVEEHSIIGGLGSTVCETLAPTRIPIRVIGIKDVFGESGTAQELFNKNGLTAEHIVEVCRESVHAHPKAAPEVKEVTELLREIPQQAAPQQPVKLADDPRGRIIKMSDEDKKKVDGVLNKMFGGRKY